jgi:predicted MFS family arabinose efflux permease
VVLLLLLLWGGQAFPWRSLETAGLLALHAVLVFLFIRVELRTPQPFFPLSIFEDRVMMVGAVGGFLLGASMFSALVYIPLFVQGVIGTSATTAGLVLMPFMLSWTFASIPAGRLALRWGFRPVMTLGMILLVGGFALLAGLTAQASIGSVVVPMMVLGAGMGLTATMFMIAMQNSVARTLRGIATSLNIFSRNIGSAIGVSLQGAVLVGVLGARLQARVGGVGVGVTTITDPQAALDSSVQTHLTAAGHEVFRQALAGAIHSIFLLGLALATLGLLVVLLYMPAGSVAELTPMEAAGAAEAD